MQEYESNPSKLIEVTRDMMLSGHIYWLYVNGNEDEADALITKLKSSKMIATKWLMQTTVISVVEWITKDLMPSDLDAPKTTQTKKK